MPKGALEDYKDPTASARLRDMLRDYEIGVANIKGKGAQSAELLRLRDWLEAEFSRREADGLDLRPERTRLATADNILEREATALLRELQAVGGLRRLREQEEPSSDGWWWYLDAQVAQRWQRKAKKFIALFVGAVLLIVGGNYLLNKLSGTSPETSQAIVHNNTAEQHVYNGEYAEAEEEYLQALETDPSLIDAYVGLGVLQDIQGDKEAAQETLAKAERLADSELQYELLLARTYQMYGEFDTALDHANQALTLDEESAQAYLIRGGIYESQGEREKALDDLEKASNLAFENGEDALYVMAKTRLGMLLQQGSGLSFPGGGF